MPSSVQALDDASGDSDDSASARPSSRGGESNRPIRELARQRRAAMLDLILAGATVPAEPASPRGRPNASASPAPPGRLRTPVLTLERFERAAGLARLCAGHGLDDLSTRAVRESLEGGPPVEPVPMTTTTAVPARSREAEPVPELAGLRVEACLVEIDALWDRRGLPPSVAYEALRDVVLPAAR